MLNPHRFFIAGLAGPSTAGSFDLRPAQPVANPFYAGQLAESARVANLLRIGIKPRHGRIDRNRRVIGEGGFGEDRGRDHAGAVFFANLEVSDRQFS